MNTDETTRFDPVSPSPSSTWATVLLWFAGLCKAFGGRVVLNFLSGAIHRGEVILLHGDNGVGKTTLIDILTGNLLPDRGQLRLLANGSDETFSFPRHWWNTLISADHFTPERVAQEGVGRTWQEIRLFGTQDIEANIAVAKQLQHGESPVWAILRPGAVRRQDRQNRVDAGNALAAIGLAGREHSSADMVSLGQSKKVAIMRAVRAGAKVLFLDEPLSGLDSDGIADVISLLTKLVREHKIALVIVEHDANIPRILDLVSTVWTLNDGSLTVQTPEAVREEMREVEPTGYLRGISVASQPQTMNLPHNGVLFQTQSETSGGQVPPLEVRDLVVHRGRRLVIGQRDPDGRLHGMSFCLHRGQRATLLAPNGWGKTTLLECLAGLIPASCGSILLNGEEVQDLPPWERARQGLCLAQARDNSFPQLLVREAFRLVGRKDYPDSVRHLMGRRISQLSGGEAQIVSLLCALNDAPAVVLLDEPHLALDHGAQTELNCILDALPGAVLIAEPKVLAIPQDQSEQS